jgi:hypothetical protein
MDMIETPEIAEKKHFSPAATTPGTAAAKRPE